MSHQQNGNGASLPSTEGHTGEEGQAVSRDEEGKELREALLGTGCKFCRVLEALLGCPV